MLAFLLRRLLTSLLLVFLVLTLTFFVLQLAPGDPTNRFNDPRVPQEAREQLRQVYGLDRPVEEQFLSWLYAIIVKGNWGISYVHQEPVTHVLARALPNTLLLAVAALTLEHFLALLMGVLAARFHGGWVDHLIRIGSLLIYSLPVFWFGLMMILLFSYRWPILPASHMASVGADALSPAGRLLDLLWHLALPAIVLGGASAGGTARFIRNNVLEGLGQDYTRTARAKGLSEARVVWVHVLRNSVGPIIQFLGLSVPRLFSGSLVVEVIFSWPGIGQLTFNAILSRDYPLILAATAMSGAMVVLGNLIADLVHRAVDPRMRHA